MPAVSMDFGFPPMKINMAERLAGKKTIIVGLPGAFTPTCSSKQIPGYMAKQEELKAKGVDEVIVYSVNDAAVNKAWAKDQGVEGSMLTILADPTGQFTEALDLGIHEEQIKAVLGNMRCRRFSMLVEDGVVKVLNVSYAPDDPTGDKDPSVSLVDNMLKSL